MPAQIAAQIRATADPIDDLNPSYAGLLGRGRVNFARALTEVHPVLDVQTAAAVSLNGTPYVVVGDTVRASFTLRNVMTPAAINVEFRISSSDPLTLSTLAGAASQQTVAEVPGGQSTALADFLLRAGSVETPRTVAIRLDWTINGTEKDAFTIPLTVLPARPLWVEDVSPTTSTLFSVRAANRNTAWAVGGNGVGVVIRTADGGATWTDATGNLSSGALYCVTALDSLRAWVGSGDGAIFATSNGGMSWVEQTYPGIRSPFINGVWMFPDGRGYAQGDPNPNQAPGRFIVLKTSDFGSTWGHVLNEPLGSATEAGWNNSFWWTDPDHGWFGTNSSRVWRTTNGGTTWSSASSVGTNSFGVAFADAALGFAVHDGGTIARTTDGGETWSLVTSPTQSMLSSVTAAPSTGSVWMTDATNMYRTRTGNAPFAREGTYPILGSLYHVSMADTTTGWLVTSAGEILQYDQGTTTDVPEPPSGVLPAGYALDQNYPNPFNPATTIRYRIAEAAYVTLAVYDMLGREVRSLVRSMQETGSYEVHFRADGLASGVYSYRITVVPGHRGTHRTASESRKMLLLR
jgi:photosystem II stability/assembly factor-like uncharacterized protein